LLALSLSKGGFPAPAGLTAGNNPCLASTSASGELSDPCLLTPDSWGLLI